MARKIKCPHCGKMFVEEKPSRQDVIQDLDLIGAMFEEDLPNLHPKANDMNWIDHWLQDHNCIVNMLSKAKISFIFLEHFVGQMHL